MSGTPLGAERWTAIRALREGMAPTFPLLATASGLYPDTIRKRAVREKWTEPPEWPGLPGSDEEAMADIPETTGGDEAPDESAAEGGAGVEGSTAGGSLEERLARVMEQLLREVEAIGAVAKGRKGALDKKRIDALGSMIRTLEKFEGFARERSRDSQTRRDGEMADVLRRIDARIVELARAYAEELGEGQRVGGGSGADP